MKKPDITDGVWQVLSKIYPYEPKEIITGVGIVREDGDIKYTYVLFDTVLPDSDLEYIGEHDQIKADAKLISAAADLADALNEAVETFDFGGEPKTALGKEIKEWIPKAIAALKKAGYTE